MPRFIRPERTRSIVGGRFDISGGDVSDWDSTESRESDEDAAWRDLVARFDAPLAAETCPLADARDVPDEAQEHPR